MPTKSEREYYREGYADGLRDQRRGFGATAGAERYVAGSILPPKKVKRKMSAWNQFVRTHSKKPRFRYRNGKLNLKKMAVAFRKTPAGRKKKR